MGQKSGDTERVGGGQRKRGKELEVQRVRGRSKRCGGYREVRGGG